MTYSQAMNIIDGIDTPEDDDQVEEAWECLISSEVIYDLPERYMDVAQSFGYL